MWGRAITYLRETLCAEQERWELWLPFFLAFGIALYFALPSQPSPIIGITLTFASISLIILEKKVKDYVFFSLFIFFFCLGFTLVSLKADCLTAPILEKKTKSVTVTGTVAATDIKGTGQRLTFENPTIEGFAKDATPTKVRIKVNGLKNRINQGDKVELRAVLMPPPLPAAPDAYDIPRKFYFEGLGAVGYAVSKVKVLEPASGLDGAFARLRSNINFHIIESLPKAEAGVAMSLITGEQGGNTKEISESYRASGIAHMLSVSGLHMSMLAGLVFGVLRFLFALLPSFCLRFHTKKIAAAIAIAVALGYLLISGLAVPAQRAFIMVSVVLLAVIFDREAISMRSIGVAMVIVLCLHPEALTSASFQMSFAAVYALIAAYEVGAGRLYKNVIGKEGQSNGKTRKAKAARYLFRLLLIWLIGTAVTDFVASTATTPFAVYHFDRYASYSMLCNLITAPILGLVVMPMLLLSTLLMPFGMDGVALGIAGWGIGLMNSAAAWISALPHSVIVIKAMPLWGLVLCVSGGIWLCLWRQKWRFIGILPIILGMLSPFAQATPDILVSQGGKLVAVKSAEGTLLIEPSRGDKMAKETWLSKNGEDYNFYDDAAAKAAWQKGYSKAGTSLTCDKAKDPSLCLYQSRQYKVAIVYDYESLKTACKDKTLSLVISKVNAKKEYCRAPFLVERKNLWRNGAVAVWLPASPKANSTANPTASLRIKTAAEGMGAWNWTPKPL